MGLFWRKERQMAKFGLGTWSHSIKDFGASAQEVAQHAQRLADGGFDLLIPCVKNPPGYLDFFTDAGNVNPDYPDWDPLAVLIEECAARDVEVHPWFCVFREGQGSRLLQEHPECKAEGERAEGWACACRPEVRDYVFSLYKSLAERYDVDGLHLDYIRTGVVCKCEYCRQEMGARGVDIDDEGMGPAQAEEWLKWRIENVTSLVRRVHELTEERGIELSAAVFAGYPWSVPSQAQDWVGWAEDGLVDYLFPMTYTNHLIVADMATQAHVALVDYRVPLWEGLAKKASAAGLPTELLAAQVKAVMAGGADGVVLFAYPSVTDEDIAAINQVRRGP